MVELVSTHWSG